MNKTLKFFVLIISAFIMVGTTNSYANMASDHPKWPKSWDKSEVGCSRSACEMKKRKMCSKNKSSCEHKGAMKWKGKHHKMNPEKMAEMMIQKFDKNQDGQLNQEELTQMVTERLKHHPGKGHSKMNKWHKKGHHKKHKHHSQE